MESRVGPGLPRSGSAISKTATKKGPPAEPLVPPAGPSDTWLPGQARLDTRWLSAHVSTEGGSFSSELFFDFVGMVLLRWCTAAKMFNDLRMSFLTINSTSVVYRIRKGVVIILGLAYLSICSSR